MKRFTETGKWSDPWFSALSKEGKLIWQFLCDKCDEGGFWTINLRDLEYFTEANREDWGVFMAAAGATRIRVVGERVWLVKFILFQFPNGLHEKNPMLIAVRRAFRQANGVDLSAGLDPPYNMLIRKLVEGATQDLRRTLQGPQEQEKEKELAEGEYRGGTGAEAPSLKEILAYADRITLAEWKARDFFAEMEACGWLDFNRRKVVSWRAMLDRVRTKWEADGRPKGPPANQYENNKRGFTKSNPRLEGVSRNNAVNDYAKIGRERMAREQAAMEAKMAADKNGSPPELGNSGAGG